MMKGYRNYDLGGVTLSLGVEVVGNLWQAISSLKESHSSRIKQGSSCDSLRGKRDEDFSTNSLINRQRFMHAHL